LIQYYEPQEKRHFDVARIASEKDERVTWKSRTSMKKRRFLEREQR